MEYIGEHTFVGQIGNFFVVLAFTAAIFAGISYFFATIRKDEAASWKRLGRIGFYIHSAAVLGIIASMFHMLFNHYFEYDYVYKHSNTSMQMRYIFSCFWEGQEGSFLLWSFWHVVLGLLLIRSAKNWEAPVMSVFSVVQVFLGSMLLGIYLFDIRIGSNPFTLIRNLPENIGLPWTQLPNYLEQIPEFQDGRGLNPLLQNYWMTIHPPTLFLGFASTLVPFAYAIAGLWKKDYSGWMKPALPWTFFSVAALGLGILMGGAWAYEALSFGGFWAWDPVENASLVPWLTLVGAGHLMLVNKRKKTSLFTTFYLTLATFVLVLYSTFLTRSGVLGDTSVHSFTDDGMLGQLLLYLIFFVFISVYLLLINGKLKKIYAGFSVLVLLVGLGFGIQNAMVTFFAIVSSVFLIYAYRQYFPKAKEEEQFWSREFWMFIGALVLLISAAQITFETSKPVYNLLAQPFSGVFAGLYDMTSIEFFKGLAEGTIAPHTDVIAHYNRWQIPFAFLITLLVSVSQFLRYKKTESKEVLKNLALAFFISVALSAFIAIAMQFELKHFSIIALLFSSIFAVSANLKYLLKFLGKKKKVPWGSSIAHIGFGLLMLGALLSTYKQIEISENTSGIDITMLSDDFDNKEDILIFQGDTLSMNEYFIHYKGKYKDGIYVKYQIEYFDVRKRAYRKGDLISYAGKVFQSIQDHTPAESFLEDMQQYWEEIKEPSEKERIQSRRWNPYKPGNKLFELEPSVQLNELMGNVPEPDTRHYLHKDVYTHIKYAELETETDSLDGYRPAKEFKLKQGDSFSTRKSIVKLNKLIPVKKDEYDTYMLSENDIAVRAQVLAYDIDGTEYEANPLFIIRDNSLTIPDEAEIEELGIKFSIETIDPETEKITLLVAEKRGGSNDFIVMQAIVFPFINILWIGCILLVLGSLIAVVQRVRSN